MKNSGLLIVDVQNDFCKGGTLEVPHAYHIIPVLNMYIRLFEEKKLPIIATRDWHPDNHCSFKEQGGIWPKHCVHDTKGAEFHPHLELPITASLIAKGTDKDRDAYSGFDGTALTSYLNHLKIKSIYVGGLATDYCVKHTVLDGIKNGFTVYLLKGAMRAVNINKSDGLKALDEMMDQGAKLYSV